jgi:acetyl-CoA acetyltransferase
MAALLAGLPVEVAGQTINRLCGSGLQAVNSAAHAIMVGDGDVMVAGGVESMTRAPIVQLKAESAFQRGAPQVADSTLGWRFVNPRLRPCTRPSRWARRLSWSPSAGASVGRTRMPSPC